MKLREYIEKRSGRSVSAVLLRSFGLDPNLEGSEKKLLQEIQKAVEKYPNLLPQFIKDVLKKKEKKSESKGGDK